MSMTCGSTLAMHPTSSSGSGDTNWAWGAVGTDDFSIAFMIKRVTTGVTAYLFDKLARIGTTTGWRIYLNTTDTLVMQVAASSYSSASSYIADTNEHAVVLVRDTSTAVYGYLDGTKSTFSGGAPSGNARQDARALTFGARNSGSAYANFSDGRRSNVAIWDYALSDNEATAISAQLLCPGYVLGTTGNLIDYWPMEHSADNLWDTAVNGDLGLTNIGKNGKGSFRADKNPLVVDTLYSAPAFTWDTPTASMYMKWPSV